MHIRHLLLLKVKIRKVNHSELGQPQHSVAVIALSSLSAQASDILCGKKNYTICGVIKDTFKFTGWALIITLEGWKTGAVVQVVK